MTLAPRDRGSRMVSLSAAWLVLASLASGPVAGLEVDTYYAWGRPLADASAVLNAKFDLEIRTAVAAAEARRRRPPTCDEITRAVRNRLELEIFQPIDLWAVQSPLLERVPADGDEVAAYRRDNLYHDAALLDIGMWMPITPVLNVDGVLIGIDKLAHFVSSGWRYHNAYRKARRKGLDPAAAEREAIRWGILEERTINGSLSTGVLSRGDLEANYGGMRFYLELCAEPEPILALDDGHWSVVRRFDIRDYVGPEWDEGYQPSVFAGYRWRRVRPILLGYCDRLSDPAVQRLLAGYRSRDRVTPTEEVFQELVDAGEVADPTPFGLLANCPTPTPAEPVAPPASAPPVATVATPAGEPHQAALEARLQALDRDRPRRVFGLLAAHLDHPKGVSTSVGAMFAHPRRSDDCRDVCVVTGSYLQGELGLYGGQLSIGYGSIVGDTGPAADFMTRVYLAAGVEAALLRTWRGSPLAPETQTLAGLEGQLSVARVSLRLGIFGRVSEHAAGDRWVLTGAVGWGF